MPTNKILFCGNALPLNLVKELNLSVAGKKYEISLLKELNNQLGDNLDIISLAPVFNIKQMVGQNSFLFNKKAFQHIRSIRLPIIRDIITNFNLLTYLLKWSLKNKKNNTKIVLLNSSLGSCIVLIIIKILFKSKIFSLTIDTPIPNINSNFFPYRFYLKITFTLGHKLLKYFDGIIVLNKNVPIALKLNIPHLISRVGYSEDLVLGEARNEINQKTPVIKKIMFAGTLVNYNGIEELVEGFINTHRLDLELHIYGYGPLENFVKKSSDINTNIIFHGSVDNTALIGFMKNADLLVNPRLTHNSVNDFGFPSKLIEYILSGTPVLTTNFNSLPSEFKNFLHIIENDTSEGIRRGIENVFNLDKKELRYKSLQAINLVKQNNNWKNITSEIIKFIDNQ